MFRVLSFPFHCLDSQKFTTKLYQKHKVFKLLFEQIRKHQKLSHALCVFIWKFRKLQDAKTDFVGKKGAKKPLLDLCEDWHGENDSGNLSLITIFAWTNTLIKEWLNSTQTQINHAISKENL